MTLSPETITAIEQWKTNAKGVGASSTCIAQHLQGQPHDGSYPRDADDFQRCENLLMAAPELRQHLTDMATVNAYWMVLVTHWETLARLHGTARTAKMRSLLHPIQDADPKTVRIGNGITISTGKTDFKGKPETLDDAIQQFKADAGSTGTMSIQVKGGSMTMPFDADIMKESLVAKLAGKQLTRAQVEAMQKKKPDPASPEFTATSDHNYNIAADELRSFIERIEQLDAEKRALAEQQKEVMAEAKGRGYDPKVMRKIIALRKRKPDEIAEEEAILDMYKSALGMG